ncbi:hypothetical protein [Paractinoplanes globisporus]|uniref:Uncharacterized protein n=1 Tax=Paractinoplanes globisporus TaxID=113565 RepID=A0ABW6WFN3_9ACTN|nr:hypothetical protein [Actinoplanes globisporus]
MTEVKPPVSTPGVMVLGKVEQVAALVLIGLFVVFIIVLIVLRDSPQWDRLAYLFGGFEALVFAAGGALFGTSVQRGQTLKAEESARKQEARADANEADAMHGRAFADVVRLKHGAPAEGEGEEGRGGRPQQQAGGDTAIAELARMADEWFPKAP